MREALAYLPHVGVYEERRCIGVFRTFAKAEQATWAHEQWQRDLSDLCFAHTRIRGWVGPLRAAYDIEVWEPGGGSLLEVASGPP